MPATATKPQSATYTRPWMAQYQTDAIFNPARYAIVAASTKSGKTVACLVWLLEQAMQGSRGQNFWWLAPVYSQAAIAYERMKFGLPRGLFKANETDLTLTLANGAVLWFKSAEKPDNLYGEDVYAAVIDEATRCREEAWHAVRSTLTATRGPIRIIGNVKGRRNWAYQLGLRAQAGEPGMHWAKITAADAVAAGVLDQAEIDDARKQLPEHVFKELYEAEPSDDEGNPFGITNIRACIEPAHADCMPRVWGWDLARATDYTAGIALCAHGRVCRFERWNQSNYASIATTGDPGDSHSAYWQVTLKRIQDATGTTPALVDSTGPGGPIDQALALDGHRNIEGYVFTQRSKQQLMEGLAVAIQQHEIGYPDGPIVLELEAFEYTYSRTGVKYTAPQGMHDDCVCALALAVQKLGSNRLSKETAGMLAGMIRHPQGVTVTPGRESAEQPRNIMQELLGSRW